MAADYNTYTTRMLSCAKVGNYSLEQVSKHMLSYIANYSILCYNEDVPRSATQLKEDKMLKEMEHLAEVPFSRPVDDAVTSSEEEHEEERQEEECQEECKEERQEEHQEEVESAKSSASSQAGPAPKRRKGERSQESYVAKEKSSHNKNRKCQIPGCKYYSPNLPQHLKVHINKGEVTPEDAKRMHEILVAGKRQRGAPVKDSKSGQYRGGRWKKWCTVAHCQALVLDMPQHLTSPWHNFKQGTRMHNMYLQAAKTYTGLGEMMLFLQSLRSASLSKKVSEEEPVEEEKEATQSEALCLSPSSGKKPATSRAKDSKTPTEYKSEEYDAWNHDSSRESSLELEGEGEEESEVPDDESEDPDFETFSIEKFFTTRKPLNNRHHWLVGFYDFLACPSMGFEKQWVRLQHACQVRKILEAVKPGGENIMLANDKGEEAWRKFLRPILDSGSKKSGTIISYLGSYEKFLKFINSQYTDDMPPLDQAVKDLLKLSEGQKGGWRSLVYNATHIEGFKQYLDESTNILKPKEIKAIKKSMMT